MCLCTCATNSATKLHMSVQAKSCHDNLAQTKSDKSDLESDRQKHFLEHFTSISVQHLYKTYSFPFVSAEDFEPFRTRNARRLIIAFNVPRGNTRIALF